jgi:hypothetical protein
MIKEPETKPISQEQLIAEVKGIYAGLVMVESKCIEVDNAQSTNKDSKLNNEQWQALIALHRTLLHEHHDFFLASQHPSASQALRRLASKYAMPARMWRHGIHSFLELLRHRLPAAREHMLTFIYLAYSMMALLYETVPAFEDTWIECLGDLGRYRMAIEDDNLSDREVWTSVSRHWYSKASDKSPSTGRLYHHLAILARPNALQQLYYYTKALCVAVPFHSARESILTLFDPILARQNTRLPSQDLQYVSVHAFIFKNLQEKQQKADMRESMDSFVNGLDMQVARNGRRWLEPGMHIANANCAALMGYGNPENPLAKLMQPGKEASVKAEDDGDVPMTETLDDVSEDFKIARELMARTNTAVWGRLGDPSILAHLHVSMVFLHHLTLCPPASSYVFPHMPLRLLCVQLNTLIAASENTARYENDHFPEGETPRPLVEDFAMRGLLWADQYFPQTWFAHEISDDDKWFEMASFMDERRMRCLWLGVRIAKHKKWIQYDAGSREFSVMPEFDDEEKVAGDEKEAAKTTSPADNAPEEGDAMDTDQTASVSSIPYILQ